jgi:hypothetical protein
VQPKGSAVNNSNTASAAFGSFLDALGKYAPMGESVIAAPKRNISAAFEARTAMDAPKALTIQQRNQMLKPSILPLGLLAED